jgi:hypothetical protein
VSGARRRSQEGWLWGAFLAIALLGAVVGVVEWLDSGEAGPPPQPLELGQPGMPLGPPPVPPLPEGFVPDLPPVPTLPPGARPSRGAAEGATDDERLDQLAGEMRLMQEARAALEHDPTGALTLLEQHRQRYPRGALSEEREVYAIEALVVLGHTEEVERRYLEFRSDFPDSTFTERLERVMQ